MREDIRNVLTIHNLRASGDVVEVSEIADEVGFGVPMFFSNELAVAMDTLQARRSVLTFLFYLSKGQDSQDVVFSYSGEDGCGAEIIATLFVPDEGPFVILALYEEVRDILEAGLNGAG